MNESFVSLINKYFLKINKFKVLMTETTSPLRQSQYGILRKIATPKGKRYESTYKTPSKSRVNF